MTALSLVAAALGYRFKNHTLLQNAVTHRSFSRDHNERMEFLGDAVLDMVVAEALYCRYPDRQEGELSQMRSTIVRGDNLAAIGRQLKLGDALRLGPGEAMSGGRDRDSNLANAVEALVAAVHLDGGIAESRAMILRLFDSHLQAAERAMQQDAKTRLQEYLQARQCPVPVYRVVEQRGSQHEACFRVLCDVPALSLSAEAEGTSIKRAGQAAAAAVLVMIEGQQYVR